MPRPSARRSWSRRLAAWRVSASSTTENREAALADMARRWPRARLIEDESVDRPLCKPRLRSRPLARRRAFARRPDRHGFRASGLGDAAQRADGARDHLFGHRLQNWQANGRARRRRRGGQKSDLVRRALSSRAGALGSAHRLPLGARAQAGDHRLGGGAGRPAAERRLRLTRQAPRPRGVLRKQVLARMSKEPGVASALRDARDRSSTIATSSLLPQHLNGRRRLRLWFKS